MLTLVTGQPGNGKTLYTLQMVEELRKKEQRPVYQSGIAGLTLPWLELQEPREWFKLPEGAIIIVDEAWKAFPVRKQGAQTPEYIEQFATHRHHGFDIFLVTQHRHQIDTFVRKMVGRHIHLVRKFGAERATVYQWEKETDTASEKEQETAITTGWDYPKEVYAWYRSAEVHTVKKDFPWRRFWWFPLLAVALVVGGIYSFHRIRHMGESKPSGSAPSSASAASASASSPPSAWASVVPRIPEIPASAPRYDSAVKIASVPYIAGCMELVVGTSVQCQCTDQSGAEVDLPTGRCVAMVRRGWFDPTRHYGNAKEENIAYLNELRGSQQVASAPLGAGAGAAGAAPAIAGSKVGS